jgi:type 2 lantibiotic biosynthesis protein LanM
MILTFNSGLKLVYKPRSLAVDLHFQELLGWLNDRSDRPPFRRLKILNGEAHGGVEFVDAAGCSSVEEVSRFYRRQGGYLAVLYTLGGTDIHYENLLAAGEHPVLIDLETLFNPVIGHGNPGEASNGEATNIVSEALPYSVLQVGLLPHRSWSTNGSEGVELSGLGGQEGQLSPHPMPGWEGSGTDRLRRVYRRILLPAALNRPTLKGSSASPLDYVTEIVEGFSAMYRLLAERQAELVAPGGPLSRFSQDPVRVVLRPTHAYQLLQEHRLRPDRLRNGLELDRHYDKLWISVKPFPYLARVIASECRDLHQDDYPFFTTRPASTHLWTSTGDQISDFLAEPGLELVVRRVARLDERDLAKQIGFIRVALTHHDIGYSTKQGQPQPF